MEWATAQKYYQPSTDGRYTVSAARTPKGIVYTAWRVQQPVAKELGCRDSAHACRALCDADASARIGSQSTSDSHAQDNPAHLEELEL